MEDIVKYLVESLVENPEDVQVISEAESERVILIKVQVNPDNLGRVIGKSGRVATAIRTIVKAASNKSGKRFIVKILSD